MKREPEKRAEPKVRAEEFRLVAWNPHRGNSAGVITATLTSEVEKFAPAVIVLNEVRNHYDTLAGWAKRHGYLHYQEKPRPATSPVDEHGSTAALVRDDAGYDVVSRRVVPMRLGWKVFSHDQPHDPRRYEVLRLRTPGGRLVKVRASHWPTNGFKGGNRLAFAESAARSAAWLTARRPRVVALDVGDHNEDVTTLRAWARRFGGKVVGHGPDSLVALGAADLDCRVMPKHESDHHLMRYRMMLP